MTSCKRSLSFIRAVLMLACLSLAAGYATSGPDSFPPGKKNSQSPAVTTRQMTASSQLHPRTMLPTGLVSAKNGQQPLSLQSTNAELPLLHPRTRLPTNIVPSNKSIESVTPRPTSVLSWFRGERRRNNSKQFMTMGQVVTNSDNGNGRKPKWLERLQNISNIASLLCVLDCTILPAVTVLLPLLGFAATPAQMEWLHGVGHSVAMYFVLPVGGSAAVTNFFSHKKPWISLPALLGLALVYLANAHGGPILSRLPHDFVHAMHCGTALHRVSNIAGCALLLGSNYMSHRLGCAFDNNKHGDGCGC